MALALFSLMHSYYGVGGPSTTTQIILQDGVLLLMEAVIKFNHLGKCLRLTKAGIFYLPRHALLVAS
jgi:hypothetical protein